jgi:uncharacterized protein (DUF58 family)
LTEAGRVLLRGVVFVALASVIVPAFGVFCVLASVLLTALVVGLAVRPRVRIDGSLPERIVAGRPTRLTYRLTNTGRLPAYNLSLRFAALPKTFDRVSADAAEDGQIVSCLAPGETADVTVTIRANRRGYYQIARPICRSSFPLNLFWFGASRRGHESLIVLPAFYRLQVPLRRLARHAQTAGMKLAGRAGVSPEYRGTRPFVPGDSPRHIDARAWARLAAPATKEYDEDCDSSVAVVLDTRLPTVPRHGVILPGRRLETGAAKDGSPLLEAAVSLCASVAYTMTPSSFIDLVLAGPQLHEFYGWPRGARLDRIHELLAGIKRSQDDPAEDVILSLADRFYEMSQVALILLSWSKPYQKLFELAEQAGCLCNVALIGEPTPDRPVGDSDPGIRGFRPRTLSPKEVLSGQVKQL